MYTVSVKASTTENPIYGPLQYLRGVGPHRSQTLGRLGLHTIHDLLYHFPRDYQDRRELKAIRGLKFGETAFIRGKVLSVRMVPTRRGRPILEVLVADDTGTIAATWFNQPFLLDKFHKGEEVLLYGKVSRYRYLQMLNPEFEFPGKEDDTLAAGRIVPIYPLTEGISQGHLRRLIKGAVDSFAHLLEEPLPEDLSEKRHLPPIQRAMGEVHFPDSMEAALEARRRFAYEEFFLFQTALALRRLRIRSEKGNAFRISPRVEEHIRRLLPFQLTRSQEEVIEEIRRDMQEERPMNRLLQGEVGSGKTAVALYALLVAIANRFQTALMAPTEVLAEQHYHTFGRYLSGSRVKMELLIGGRSSSLRKEGLKALKDGRIDLAVGTHALISKDVQFKNLGLVVIDEQHKFGVLQRGRMRQKGTRPDVLVMTATPIPRSLSLTLYGELDLSIIKELPPGRTPVKTLWIPQRKLPEAYELIYKELKKGRQAFVVYPLVEESERLDLKSATEGSERLKALFPEFKVGLIHGRMTPELKEKIMSEFRQKELDILVSTIVIEVGIDIPNASVMVIEHAERFGLAQLHQLRGRIGRGSESGPVVSGANLSGGYCLLFADPRTQEARQRLEVITRTNDGFKIAEEDLRLRGPGELFGTRQHGLPDLKIADLVRDISILKMAREDAFKMVEKDPFLQKSPLVKKGVLGRYTGRFRLPGIG